MCYVIPSALAFIGVILVLNMKNNLFLPLVILTILVFISCEERGIRYELYSNGKLAFEILPEDIEFYDTTQVRGFIQIHEIRLKKGFYKDSVIVLECPVKLICEINGKEYFKAKHFTLTQSQPGLGVYFHFDPNCENRWDFNETDATGAYRGDTFRIFTNNECNSIELFHRKNRIAKRRKPYYEKKEYFRKYIKTKRLSHELLLDPYYLNALKESGVEN